MAWLGIIAGVVLNFGILLDAFEVMILPRRVRHPLRLTQLFYRSTWLLCRWGANSSRQAGFGRLFSGFLGLSRCLPLSLSGPFVSSSASL